MIAKPIVSFNAGELSPWLDGRIDLEKYGAGCRKLDNFLLTPYGGVRRRPGLQWVDELESEPGVASTRVGRLIPFQFSATVNYMLLLNEDTISFYLGGTSPAQTANVVDTTWADADLIEVQTAQQNDVMYLTHGSKPPQRLTRQEPTVFNIEDANWKWAPMRDENQDEAITISASAVDGGNVILTGVGTDWEDNLIGARFRIAHERVEGEWGANLSLDSKKDYDRLSDEVLIQGDWTFTKSGGLLKGGVKLQRFNSAKSGTWEDLRSYHDLGENSPIASGYEDELVRMRIWGGQDAWDGSTPSNPTTMLEAGDGEPYGEVEVVSVESTTSMTVNVKHRLFKTDATHLWSEGAFSVKSGYPSSVVFHEGRLVFGGTDLDPQDLWGSKSDDYLNFRSGTNDDDSYHHRLSAGEHNRITWMVSERKLVIGTTGGEFVVGGDDSKDIITPSSKSARRHSNQGSAKVQAAFVNDAIIYAQRGGRKIFEYGYVFQRDRYKPIDLTRLGEHITKQGVTQFAFQQQRDRILWVVTSTGELAGLTYERDEDVLGWHNHSTEGGTFDSVAVMHGSDEEDEVWTVVARTVGGASKRYLERMEPSQYKTQEDGTKARFFYVDSGLVQTGTDLAGINLAHLEGEVVQLNADGVQYSGITVASGVAALPSGKTASKIIGGIKITSRLEPMKIDSPTNNGTSRGREGQITRLDVNLWQSLGGKFGETAIGAVSGLDLDDIVYRASDSPMDAAPSLFTGEFELDCDFSIREEVTVGIVNDSIYPMSILMLILKMEFQGDQ